MRIIVTGGSGFVGSTVCRYIIEHTDWDVINVSRSAYSSLNGRLESVRNSDRYFFAQGNICDLDFLKNVFWKYSPTAVIHLAAESNVDKSLVSSDNFLESNIFGTNTLLEATTSYWKLLPDCQKSNFRFIHISTVDVYGALQQKEKFKEDCPYRPSSPYAASKAASEQLVWAFGISYDLPIIITNCSNNYGSYQSPKNLIPKTITRALKGEKISVYGRGQQIRNWLNVEDHARAIIEILKFGQPLEKYNIGTNDELSNLDVVKRICQIIDKFLPSSEFNKRENLIEFVPDRNGHNYRCSIDWSKINQEINWSPKQSFDSGLEKTVKWYIEHERWWQMATVQNLVQCRTVLV